MELHCSYMLETILKNFYVILASIATIQIVVEVVAPLVSKHCYSLIIRGIGDSGHVGLDFGKLCGFFLRREVDLLSRDMFHLH